MPASSTLTWDLAVARRPDVADVGGAVCQNGTPAPPDDGTHIYADMMNELQRQVVALGRMVPSARLSIGFIAGTPTLVSLDAASSTLLAGDFTLTDNGVGDVTITWAAGKLPPMNCQPVGNVTGNTTQTASFSCFNVTATSIRCRVMINGVASDTGFTVQIN